jgi:hypothetical protein
LAAGASLKIYNCNARVASEFSTLYVESIFRLERFFGIIAKNENNFLKFRKPQPVAELFKRE